ncbi:glycosyl hydrolase [Echinicola jeungdonensis]|uniref:Glycosyl hydrolase n=1 Tax=Echinicola jeungdonensis TaxID=709343 RepID=A0ABV5J8F4_9BACT|nr:glycosyl hydrolase [Echinicola jeungdonensis]MDN3669449.1 glycosyl hydrolase [Echinicola jeungdonensis]
MTLKKRILFLIFLLGLLNLGCQSQQEDQESSAIKPGTWPEITREAKPWTRWWWMGNAVDKKNTRHLLESYEDAGLGGVEIAPIYGAKGFEERYLEFLSDPWLEHLHFTTKVADSLGMGVDLTQGTGWPFGGPFVEPAYAASKLVVKDYDFVGPGTFEKDLNLDIESREEFSPQLLAVMAYGENGEVMEITDEVSEGGQLIWQTEGSWNIKAIYNGKTGQKVKRAAPGGKGYTLDHYSKMAVEDYLSEFEKAFGGNIPDIRAFYNDSFEVYGANFTASFLEEFQSRRGYDLKPYIPELLSEETSEKVARIKSDYRETLHELLLENFTKNWTEWAHNRGKKTKNQAHGSPGNLLDLYAAVDIPECETFGSSYFPIPGLRRDSADIRNVDPDPIMLKFASSAGHLAGKDLISCETFTWLGEHFKSSFSQMKPEVEQAFLAGINHVFYHGVTYSPEDIDFPGWLFYASLNLNEHNSLWPHFESINNYIARCQSVLQSGKPDNEIIMYWPVYDVWSEEGNMFKMISVHHIDQWLHPTEFYKQSTELMEKGYSVDFASDQLLAGAKVENGGIKTHDQANSAKVLIIPSLKYMPVTTLRNAINLAQDGAKVIFQAKPGQVPGFHEVNTRQNELDQLWSQLEFNDLQIAEVGKGKIILSDQVQNSLKNEGIERETLTDTGLKFIRRASGQDKYYFLVNHTPKEINQSIELNMEADRVMLLDPQDGAIGQAQSSVQNGKTQVKVQMLPGEALILQALHSSDVSINPWSYRGEKTSSIQLEGPWTLKFTGGGPMLLESQELKEIKPWTALGDEAAEHFSGQGLYKAQFTLDKKEGQKYILYLGKVHESAKVIINNQEAGYAWSIPYELDVTDYLDNGENQIQIEVANLMANRIRYMDQEGISWRNYHEINFVNIDYQDFDASGWEVMPSGLEGPVTLKGYNIQVP